jgi:hypothetical protein
MTFEQDDRANAHQFPCAGPEDPQPAWNESIPVCTISTQGNSILDRVRLRLVDIRTNRASPVWRTKLLRSRSVHGFGIRSVALIMALPLAT